MKRIFLTAACACAMSLGIAQDAGVITYTMASPDATIYAWGTSKRETYDVAIHLCDPEHTGQQVAGIAVPYNRQATIDQYTAWLSTELKLVTADGKTSNAPDIESVACTKDENAGWLTAVFSEPYTIPEEGVYIGYSFTVTALTNDYDRQPVAVVHETHPGGLWLHTSRSYLKWDDYTEGFGMTSAMRVYLKGDFALNAAVLNSMSDVACIVDGNPSVEVNLQNMGSAGIKSLGYTYEIDGTSTELTYDLPLPITIYGASADVAIPLPSQKAPGASPFSITITSVNGAPNEMAGQKASAVYYAYDWEPRYTPFYEEFTGLWCGWCPSGYVGMQEMHRLYGEDFVCASYHYNDAMHMKGGFPAFNDESYPFGCFDRTYVAGPYGGFSDLWEWLLPEAYDQVRAMGKPTGQVDAACAWVEDDKVLRVDATAKFIYNAGKKYRLSYILLQNDMHSDAYVQKNYFYKNEAYKTLPLLSDFANGKEKVRGLHYDDVAILTSNFLGVEGSIPDDYQPSVEYTHQYTFNLDDAVNMAGESLVQHAGKLDVIVCLVEDNGTAFGRVDNCCLVRVQPSSSIQGIVHEAEIASEKYYDMQGRAYDEAPQGVSVRVATMRDGSVITQKINK